MTTTDAFQGAKVALFIGDRLLVTLRDDFAHIPYPGAWDLPGGGREADETPEQTLAREVMEEVGLVIPPDALIWRRRYPAAHAPGAHVWFFVAQMVAETAEQIVFGDEGQGWKLVTLDEFLVMPGAVPSFAPRLRDWLADRRK